MSMTAFRRINIDGPDFSKGEGAGAPPSGYLVNVVGPLFAAPAAMDRLTRCTKPSVWWRLCVSARLPEADALPDPSFAPQIDPVDMSGVVTDPLLLFELPPEAFSDDAVWLTLAPQTSVTVHVTAVANTDPGWAQFKSDVTAWRDVFAKYEANAAAKDILDFLQAWVDTDGTAPPPPSRNVTGYTWGLPRLGEGRPTAVKIAHAAIGHWRVPAKAGVVERELVRQLMPSKVANGYDQDKFKAVRERVRAEMRRLSAARKAREEGNQFLNYRPFAVSLRDKDLASAALAVGLAKGGGGVPLLPTCADVMVAVAIETKDDDAGAPAKVIALIKAVEAVPFTELAIVELGALEDGGKGALVHFPGNALARSDVVAALAGFAADHPAAWKAVSVLLRMAPTDTERGKIMDAIDTAVDEALRARLRAFVDDAMAGQIFGSGRTPGLKVFRGTADPAQDAIVRAQPEPSPCQ